MTDQPSQPLQANLSQRYPATSYNTTYPWNTVFQQEWGQMEFDNTQGSERHRVVHRTGTGHEISKDGRKIEATVANHYHYVKGGHTETYDNNKDVKHSGGTAYRHTGDHYEDIKGDHYHSIGGDHVQAIKGTHTHIITGNHYHSVQGDSNMRWNGSHNHFTVGDVTTKSNGSQLHYTDGSHTTTANSDIIHTTNANFTTTSSQNTSFSSGSNYTITAKSSYSVNGQSVTVASTGGDHNLKASGSVITQGSSTKLQGGGMQVPPITVS